MNELIRNIEQTVLDTHHYSKPIFRKPAFQAIGHLLKVYGNLHRDFDSPAFAKFSDQTLSQHVIIFSQALEWCVRWIATQCPNSTNASTDHWKTIDKQIISLLEWGVQYARLVCAHTAWSRGEMVADADKASQTITFSIKEKNPRVLLGQSTFLSLASARFSDAVPHDELQRVFRHWKHGYVNICPPEIPDIDFNADDPLCETVYQTARKMIVPELTDHECLGKFSLGQYRRLWSVLFVHCYLLSELEGYCDRKFGDENNLGSNVFQFSRQKMVEYLASLALIENESADAILELLTFATDYSGSIASQPFVMTECGTVSLLARLFCSVEPSDSLPRALLRKSPKVYDSIINRIEVENVTQIGESLGSHSLAVRTHQRLSNGGKYITPDLLVFDKQTDDLLVADYKHSLTPSGPAEVANRTSDHRKHVDQVKRYVEIIKRCPFELHRVFGFAITPKRFFGMVLYKSTMPLPAEHDEDVIIADWMSFRKLIVSEPIFDLGRTVKRYQELSNDSFERYPWQVYSMDTIVGAWTYRHEYFAAD